MKDKIVVKSFYRIGILVHSIDQKLGLFKKYFDFDESKIRMVDPANLPDTDGGATYNGEPLMFKAKLCIFPLGNLEMELIEPIDKRGPYYDFLMEHGEGLHHFNVDVTDTERFKEVCGELGISTLLTGQIVRTYYEYFDTRAPFGMILETCEDREPLKQ